MVDYDIDRLILRFEGTRMLIKMEINNYSYIQLNEIEKIDNLFKKNLNIKLMLIRCKKLKKVFFS